jgi:hypothetical protein
MHCTLNAHSGPRCAHVHRVDNSLDRTWSAQGVRLGTVMGRGRQRECETAQRTGALRCTSGLRDWGRSREHVGTQRRVVLEARIDKRGRYWVRQVHTADMAGKEVSL